MQNDLISRSALMKRISHHTVHDSLRRISFSEANAYEKTKGDMFNLVKSAPIIDAVPVVHARWVAETKRMGHYSHCSECGCRCQGYAPNYKYCPGCGAKMDAKEENQ